MYQVWILNDDYSPLALLTRWTKLQYRVALNDVSGASIELMANDPKLEDIGLMKRLRIVRDGVDVWGGILLNMAWTVAQDAPAGDTYALDALDHAVYAAWRTIPRPSGEHFDTVTGHADDVAKSFVRRHLGSSAASERRFSDLTVAADAGAAESTSRSWVGGTVLEHLQRLAEGKAFYWRFVPSATGVEFRTAYPLWGLDRTQGNGVNSELIFSLDRGNVAELAYRKDLTEHYNTIYVAGAGEGKDQVVVTRANAPYVTAYKRREQWVSATSYTATADLEDEGDRAIAEAKPVEVMSATPLAGAVTPANLGDKCTIRCVRYGRTFAMNAIIRAISFEVGADGVEYAKPEFVAI
jgi:hypothetical protein